MQNFLPTFSLEEVHGLGSDRRYSNIALISIEFSSIVFGASMSDANATF
jgi:hypothetical protein